eukprot:8748793-Lingulodinium_polyedra.AAC.1
MVRARVRPRRHWERQAFPRVCGRACPAPPARPDALVCAQAPGHRQALLVARACSLPAPRPPRGAPVRALHRGLGCPCDGPRGLLAQDAR